MGMLQMAGGETMLSLCMFGRNDGYGVDFLRRFEQAVNFLAYGADKAGVLGRIELLFADWGCDPSPMAEAVKLTREAASIVKFIEVPFATASKYNNPKFPFNNILSQNVAIRRARGLYIGFMPADVMLPQLSLRNLMDIISGGTGELPFDPMESLLCVPRKFLPSHFHDASRFRTPETMAKVLSLGDYYLEEDKATNGVCGGYGIMVAHRRLMDELRAGNEELVGWGPTDVDMGFRANCSHRLVNLSGFGVVSYDFAPTKKTVSEKTKRQAILRQTIRDKMANDENWGLNGADFNCVAVKPGFTPGTLPDSAIHAAQLIDPNSRLDLLAASQMISLAQTCPFSAESIVLWILSRHLRPDSYLEINSGDVSTALAVSLSCPGSDLNIISSLEGNVRSFTLLGGLFCATRHFGSVEIIPAEIPATGLSDETKARIEGVKCGLAFINLCGAAIGFSGLLGDLKRNLPAGFALLLKFKKLDEDEVLKVLKDDLPEKSIFLAKEAGLAICVDSAGVPRMELLPEEKTSSTWRPLAGNFVSHGLVSLLKSNYRMEAAAIFKAFAKADIKSLFKALMALKRQ